MNIHGSIHTRSRLYLYVYVYSRGRSIRICICMFVINTMRFTITLSSFFFPLYLRPLETKSFKRVTSASTTTRSDSCTLIATPSDIQTHPRLPEANRKQRSEATRGQTLAFQSDEKIDRTSAKVVRRFVELRDEARRIHESLKIAIFGNRRNRKYAIDR